MPTTYALKLTWPDGVTAVPLRNLSREVAEHFQRELQPEYDRDGRGTLISVIQLAD